jgi:hypothetical protein
MHSISCSQSKFPHSRQKANGSRRAPLLYQPGTTQYTKLLKQQRILPGNSMPALRDRYFARYQSGDQGTGFLSVPSSSLPRCDVTELSRQGCQHIRGPRPSSNDGVTNTIRSGRRGYRIPVAGAATRRSFIS